MKKYHQQQTRPTINRRRLGERKQADLDLARAQGKRETTEALWLALLTSLQHAPHVSLAFLSLSNDKVEDTSEQTTPECIHEKPIARDETYLSFLHPNETVDSIKQRQLDNCLPFREEARDD